MTKGYSITQQDSRIIVVLKGIFAVMVVFIHANYGGINLSTGNTEFDIPVWFETIKKILSVYIPNCAVPGFFIIAAVLLYRKPFVWKDNMKKKVRTLLVPYLIINAFWIVFYWVAQTVPSLCIYFSDPNKMVRNWGGRELLNAFLGFDKSNGAGIIYGPLWFVRDLFCLNIIAIIIKKTVDRFPIIYGVFLAFAVILNISSPIFCLSRNAVVFFSIGYYCVKYYIHFSDIIKMRIVPLSVVYSLLIAILVVVGTSQFSYTYLIVYADIIIGIIFWIKVSSYLTDLSGTIQRVIFNLSKYSFCIYIFHQIPTTILEKIMYRILPKTELSYIVQYFSVIIIIIAWCILLSKFLERFTPRTYSVLTGCRLSSRVEEVRTRQ